MKIQFVFRLRTLLIAVTIVCIVFAYAGSYVKFLQPAIYITDTTGGLLNGHREVDYRSGGQFTHVFFAPAHYIDRQVRSVYWNNWDCFNPSDMAEVDANLQRLR